MSVKTPIFKILRCRCNWQRRDAEPVSPVPLCPKCGAQPAYSTDWYMKVIVDGKPRIQAISRHKRHAETALTKAEAEIFYDRFQVSRDQPLLSEAIDTVYHQRWAPKKDGEGFRRRAEIAMEIMGDMRLDMIDDKRLLTLTKELRKRGVEESTINRYRSVLRTILRVHKLDTSHIIMGTERPGRIKVYSHAEEVAILKAFAATRHPSRRGHYAEMPDLCAVLADTGMRGKELLNQPLYDINFDHNLITIWINKADKPRSVPMTTRVRAILWERRNRRRLFDLTGVAQADHAWQWLRREMGQDHDKDYVLHAWRHTCATRLIAAGVDIYRVKTWLGHKTIKTTERYVHLAPHYLADAAQVLELANQQSINRTSTDYVSDYCI